MTMNNEKILNNLFEPKAAKYYGNKFRQIEKQGWLMPTWNWGCFLFSGLWMLYRKLPSLWFLYIFILFPAIQIFYVSYGAVGFYFYYLFIAKIVFPMYANAYMYWKANRFINKTRIKGDDPASTKYRYALASISSGSENNPNIFD